MKPEAFDELERLEAEHWWFKGMRRITTGLIPETLKQHTDLRILDAGCGVGGNLQALASLGAGFGVDYSFYALRHASQSQAGSLCQTTVEALPFRSSSFDLIVSFDVISNAGVMDDRQALQEFERVLCPGGYLVLRLPAIARLYGAHDLYIDNARRYEAKPLKTLLAKVGLTPIRLTYANAFLLPLIFAMRKVQMLKLRLTASTPQSDITPATGPLNQILYGLLKLEAYWIRTGHYFPVGVSLYALAQK